MSWGQQGSREGKGKVAIVQDRQGLGEMVRIGTQLS